MEVKTTVPPAIPMRCPICDKKYWHAVTTLRDGREVPIHSQAKTQVCKGCGYACHEVDVSKEPEVLDFYRKEYRAQPTVMNLITTTHKSNYMRVFLSEFLQETQKAGKRMVVGDVGAATGYALNMFRNMGHLVTGSELTITFRRMAEHYYGIPLTEKLEPKHRYDLIIVYHVLEHLYDPDKKLQEFVNLLAPGGKMLVATPEWFDYIEDASGVQVQSFENLFHKNHINLFSSTSLQNVFRKCGLRVVKEDHQQYGQTYLLEKRADIVHPAQPVPDGAWLTKEDWRETVKTMQRHEHAIRLFNAGQFREATKLEPRFPEAWLAQVFHKFSKDLAKQSDLISEAEQHVSFNYRFKLAKGQWLYQQGRLAEAIAVLREVVALKPSEDIYMYLGYALAQSGQPQEAIKAFGIACGMDPRKWAEAQQWMLNVACQQPTWDEAMLAEAAKQLKLQPIAEEPKPAHIPVPGDGEPQTDNPSPLAEVEQPAAEPQGATA
jgi:tetratricopeptide (TPR) repeat protein